MIDQEVSYNMAGLLESCGYTGGVEVGSCVDTCFRG